MTAKTMAEKPVFNLETKENFLENYNIEGTRKNYLRVFTKTAPLEQKMGKDLYEFNEKELSKALKAFDSRNRATLESYARYISSYLNWAISEGLAEVNLLEKLKPNDFLRFVVHQEQYITEEFLTKIENQMENYQDSVISRLIFEGVGGKGFTELLNLKEEDVDFENCTLTLYEETNDGIKIRELKVSLHAIELIRGALNQKRYVKRNGNSVGRGAFLELKDNGYVIKTAMTNAETNEATGIDTIYRRLRVIEEDLGLDSFKAKLIQRSGIINMASKISKKGVRVDSDILKEVAKRYKVNTIHSMRSYVTEENLKKYV